MTPRPIALLTDFGYRDPFVGICRAVIMREDPAIPILDLTHGIARQDVRAGAVALEDAARFLPDDCVVIAVVDPGVGSDRRAVAVECEDGVIFVGPDNGLLEPAIRARGGASKAFEISGSSWRLEPVSSTFHGRDIFSPVAARLAAGEAIEKAGDPIDPAELVPLDLPGTTMIDGDLTTAVISIDEYGNARLAATTDDLTPIEFGDVFEIDTEDLRRQATYVATYSEREGNDPLLIVDSTGALSVSINGGDAAGALRLEPGKVVRILRP